MFGLVSEVGEAFDEPDEEDSNVCRPDCVKLREFGVFGEGSVLKVLEPGSEPLPGCLGETGEGRGGTTVRGDGKSKCRVPSPGYGVMGEGRKSGRELVLEPSVGDEAGDGSSDGR